MAYKNMSKGYLRLGASRKNEFDETLAAPGNGDWVLVPTKAQGVNVAFITSGGSGKIQYTHDKIETVKTGSPVAFDWDLGQQTENADDVLHNVTAIRLVNVSGTVRMVGGAV